MTISILTCDDKVDQIIRVSAENGSPQDIQFRDPATFVGAGVATYGVDTNETNLTGTEFISWLSTNGPITHAGSSICLVWCTFGYSCDESTANTFTLSAVLTESATEVIVASAILGIALPQRQVTLFGVVNVQNEPFMWRLECTSDSGVETIPEQQLRLMWIELAGPYVPPTPPPP